MVRKNKKSKKVMCWEVLPTSLVGTFIIAYLLAGFYHPEPITDINLVSFIITIIFAEIAILGTFFAVTGAILFYFQFTSGDENMKWLLITIAMTVGGLIVLNHFGGYILKLGAILIGMS